MSYDEIFTAYYTQYRAESQVPASTDDEYTIGLRLANEAINRWSNYDGTYWKELFDTLQGADDGDKILVSAKTAYETPSDMKEAGGFVKIIDANGNTQVHIPIIEPQEAQFRNDSSKYAYFTGNVADGFMLNINPAPTTTQVGMSIDYVYYKTATELTKGSDTTEMSEPYFMVHRMLANRFRASRNPYYTKAKADAEDVLKTMQLDNNSGSWANPWKLADNSGSMFGA